MAAGLRVWFYVFDCKWCALGSLRFWLRLGAGSICTFRLPNHRSVSSVCGLLYLPPRSGLKGGPRNWPHVGRSGGIVWRGLLACPRLRMDLVPHFPFRRKFMFHPHTSDSVSWARGSCHVPGHRVACGSPGGSLWLCCSGGLRISSSGVRVLSQALFWPRYDCSRHMLVSGQTHSDVASTWKARSTRNYHLSIVLTRELVRLFPWNVLHREVRR
mmetsp:Transcript_2151/g.4925  ORF Transcript_2151/g.4925 Transcript_2151/m.4925 type:complete len:214 (-) Transcript_2151:39-680(-)